MRFAFIREHREGFPVDLMCDVLEVSRSGFYAWNSREASPRDSRRASLVERIRAAHAESRRTYGSPRVHRALAARGVACCENTVAKLMRAEGLRPLRRRRYVRTTDSRHGREVAPNILAREFYPARPDRVWASDITYIPTGAGWLYLAVVLDLATRRVVGWATADHLRAELPLEALRRALASRRPPRSLLHHSDRGSQYAGAAYRELLASHGIEASMSRAGDCWDNAVVESFFGTLKQELVHHARYADHAEAERSLFEYIEVFYNRERLHSTLGYHSPAEYESRLT